MRNVVIFTAGRERHAVELRWVREIVPLGYVTPVPAAPPSIAGAVNIHGTIVAVLDLTRRRARGPSAMVLQVDDQIVALAIEAVDEVVTKTISDAGTLVDAQEREIKLISPPDLVDGVKQEIQGTTG